MRIGIDVDGVLADFSSHYQQVLVQTSGRNLFQPGDAEDSPCWDWDKYRGYTSEERNAAWAAIKADPAWWLNHEPIEPNTSALSTLLNTLERRHDLYYITSRVGERAKRQTEIWLFDRLVYPMRAPGVYPTVLIAGHRTKGLFAKALGLDCYIDDNYDNVCDVARESPTTRTYLRTRRYNTYEMLGDPEIFLHPYPAVPPSVTRVRTLGDMLDLEIAAHHL